VLFRSEIGYWTAPWARGTGVATRALTLLSGWATAPAGLGVRRLELYAEPGNGLSQRVAERAGFVRGDLVRGGIALRGRRRDVVRFVLEP
jgi:RimJ/RimL family protein N-acetyltransferase